MFNFKINHLFHDAVECLVAALEARDPYSFGHSERVAEMALDLGRYIGLKGRELEILHIAAHLHDIGKIGVPDQILRKTGKLLPHEWAAIQRHPEIGYNILSKSKHLKQIAKIVLHHHERWDGKGYPSGLKGESTPLLVRIITICDSIDAITSKRPYREALSWDKCREQLEAGKASQFDAVLVDAILDVWPQWVKKWSLKKVENLSFSYAEKVQVQA